MHIHTLIPYRKNFSLYILIIFVSLEKLHISVLCISIYIYVYAHLQRGPLSVMVIIIGNGHSELSSILDEDVLISHCASILGKGMHPTILFPSLIQ